MSPGPGKTREEIKKDLLLRLEFARTQFEKIRLVAGEPLGVSADALRTTEYTLALHRAHNQIALAQHALLLYQQALNTFSAFIIDGEIPEALS